MSRNSSRPRNSGKPDSRIASALLESGMAHIPGFKRSQLLLLPEAVDDYVGADNPVRFIDAFVDRLDLVEAGFARVNAKATGGAARTGRSILGDLVTSRTRTSFERRFRAV